MAPHMGLVTRTEVWIHQHKFDRVRTHPVHDRELTFLDRGLIVYSYGRSSWPDSVVWARLWTRQHFMVANRGIQYLVVTMGAREATGNLSLQSHAHLGARVADWHRLQAQSGRGAAPRGEGPLPRYRKTSSTRVRGRAEIRPAPAGRAEVRPAPALGAHRMKPSTQAQDRSADRPAPALEAQNRL